MYKGGHVPAMLYVEVRGHLVRVGSLLLSCVRLGSILSTANNEDEIIYRHNLESSEIKPYIYMILR